ncbi:expressed unknown protein [Seminavis robusta]|uniref:Uncharacterized protein n=1 Tax=Seminavis robusta TaxID=568900 RepID=A0A9N8HXU0_9STRA|nr:expressed unknown protein [Seminavis robusta]|eukprot:Sro1868_g302590.1 n/a (139) ;mRNA; f:6712-7128
MMWRSTNRLLMGTLTSRAQSGRQYSDQAKDFVSKLLTYKDEERPTAEEALSHPWITGDNSGVPFAAAEPQIVWSAGKHNTPTEQSKDLAMFVATRKEQDQPEARHDRHKGTEKDEDVSATRQVPPEPHKLTPSLLKNQ